MPTSSSRPGANRLLWIVGLAGVPTLSIALVAMTCQTRSRPGPDKPAAFSSEKATAPVEDCLTLWSDDASKPTSRQGLPFTASGPVGSFGGRKVSAEQFHRFLRWYQAATNGDITRLRSKDNAARRAIEFYAVTWLADDHNVTVTTRAIDRALQAVRSGFSDKKAFETYLDDLGISQTVLRADLCLNLRIRGLGKSMGKEAADDAAVRNWYDDHLAGGSEPRDFRDLRPTLRRHLTRGNREKAVLSNPKLNRDTELLTSNITRQPDASSAKHRTYWERTWTVVAIGGPNGWRFRYPEQSFGTEKMPEATLDHLIVPPAAELELRLKTRHIPRRLILERDDGPAVVLDTFQDNRIRIGHPSATATLGDALNFRSARGWTLAASGIHFAATTYTIDTKTSDKQGLLRPVGATRSPLVSPRPIPVSIHPPKALEAQLEAAEKPATGQEVYAQHCVQCHGSEGKGMPPSFPPLADVGWTNGEKSPEALIRAVVLGSNAPELKGPTKIDGQTYRMGMATFGKLRSEEIARAINYVTRSWGNDGPTVSPKQVQPILCNITDEPRLRIGVDEDEIDDLLEEAENEGTCRPSIREQLEKNRSLPASQPEAVADLYEEFCANCHGKEGRGDGPTSRTFDLAVPNFHNPEDWHGGRTTLDAYTAITTGVDGTAMPPFRSLSGSGGWHLARYVVGWLDESDRDGRPQTDVTRLCRHLTAGRSLYQSPCAP